MNLLVGGVDEDGPGLYYIDYLGSMHKMPFGAHGYGSFFVLATLDALYRPNMGLEEATKVMMTCIAEIKTRFLVNAPLYNLKVVTKDGVTVLPTPQ